jgi:two-component system, cell cycle sensor histidine kinase and response regulator CckA
LLNADMGAEEGEWAEQILRAAERAGNLTRQLLLFSRKQVLQPANVNLNDVVAGMVKMFKRILGEDINLVSELAPDLPLIHADTGMIEQVLLNLAVNARDAMPDGGRLTIATTRLTLEAKQTRHPQAAPGTYVRLSVRDTGCGMSPEIQKHIFEPFFTTKEPGKGTGLGLATVYSIVQQHRGWLNVDSERGKGSTFHVFFPGVEATRIEPKAAASAQQLPRGSETILVVEDELSLRLLVSRVLERCGYTVLSAHSGAAALEVWLGHRDAIALLLTDVVMPEGINGFELARRLQAEKQGLKVIYTSGYTARAGEGPDLIEGVNFFQKPYSSRRLAQTVRSCLDQKL